MDRPAYSLCKEISGRVLIIERNGERSMWIAKDCVGPFICAVSGKEYPEGTRCYSPSGPGGISYRKERIAVESLELIRR